MTLVLRKVEKKVLWSNDAGNELANCPPGELPADALPDLKTLENALSVYFLDDGGEVSAERVIGALAAKRDHVANVTFITFDVGLLQELGLETNEALGQTLDAGVNACHRDLIHLTARKVAELGSCMRARGQLQRIPVNQVGKIINSSVRAGHIPVDGIPAPVRESLKEPRYSVQ